MDTVGGKRRSEKGSQKVHLVGFQVDVFLTSTHAMSESGVGIFFAAAAAFYKFPPAGKVVVKKKNTPCSLSGPTDGCRHRKEKKLAEQRKRLKIL